MRYKDSAYYEYLKRNGLPDTDTNWAGYSYEREREASIPTDENSLVDLWHKITGSGLTTAEKQANAFNAEQAELQRTWAEGMYQKYNTISAQRKQWEDAGFNPAMAMTGGNAVQPAPTSASSASSVSPSAEPSFLMSLLSTVIGAIQNKRHLDIEDKKADNLGELQKAEAGLTETKNAIEKINEQYAEIQKQLEVSKTREQINNIIEDTRLKGTEILVNGERINLMVSQEWLNQSNYDLNTQKILESEAMVEKLTAAANLDRWNARKIEEMLPLEKAFTEAQTQLANARTDTERTQAKLNLENASKAFVDGMAQRHMIYSGYYEAQTDKLLQDTATGKARESYLKAGTGKLEAETEEAKASALVAKATVFSKIFKSYTTDLFTGSTTTYTDAKGKVTGTATTVSSY